MKSMKDEFAELLGNNKVTEIDSRTCEGCGEKVVTKQFTIFAGPRKGEVAQREIGCRCLEIAEVREALENHKRFMAGGL